MSWDLVVWPASTLESGENRSFENAGEIQGTADRWGVRALGGDEGIGAFDVILGGGGGGLSYYWGSSHWDDVFSGDGGTDVVAWSPWEDCEHFWRMPYYVHYVVDASVGSVITAPDATVGDWASQRTLIIAVLAAYKNHQRQGSPVHLAPDLINTLNVAIPDDLAQAIDFTNQLKAALYAVDSEGRISGHFVRTAQWAYWHGREDVLNRPTLPTAASESSMVALINHLKVKINAHLQLIGYGAENSTALFAFEESDLSVGFIRDLPYESFARGWAIPDILPQAFGLPPLPARQECQADMVDLNPGMGGGGGWGFDLLAPANVLPSKWGELRWGTNQRTSWKTGHEEFWGDLSNVGTEWGLNGGERFDQQWYMPGANTDWANQRFVSEFLDEITGEWRFKENRLRTGTVDTFESGWRDNELGQTKYWDGTKWRFTATQVYASGFGEYVFGYYDLVGPAEHKAAALPLFSSKLALHVTTAMESTGYFRTSFLDAEGTEQVCYWFVDAAAQAVGSTVLEVGLTNVSADPRYVFGSAFHGAKQLVDISPTFDGSTGRAEWRGSLTIAENFESDWTLALTI